MTPERQKIVDNIRNITGITILVVFALGVLLILPSIWGLNIPKNVTSIISKVLITLFCLSVAVAFITSIWATDEQREQDKTDMKDILQEIKEEENAERKTRKKPANVKCPLVNLTPLQIEAVQEIILAIPVKTYIANADLMALCAALQAAGYLPPQEDLDLDSFIDWVDDFRAPEKVDAVHFRHEYYNRPPKDYKVKRMEKKLQERLDKLR